MSTRIILATFGHEEDVKAAAASLRHHGYPIRDVYSPHAIHGMDHALGLRPSRLTWVCFVCGLVGLVGMLWFQHWVSAIDWPINVGGKPWNSLPAEVPAAFEMMILLAAFGSVLACLAACRLYPGRQPPRINPRVSDDLYVIALSESPRAGDRDELRALLRQYDVVGVEERIEP